MINKWFIKIIGGTVDNSADGGNVSIEVPILGISPSVTDDGETVTSWTGNRLHLPLLRKTYKVNFEGYSTDWGTSNKEYDDFLSLIAVLKKRYIWLIKPSTSGYYLPDRWNTGGYFNSAVAVVCTEGIELGEYDGGWESLTLTFEERAVVS